MKLFLATAITALVALALAAPAHAQTTRTTRSTIALSSDNLPARRAAPAWLGASKRLARVNVMLKSAGLKLLTGTPQTLEMRVTPAAPRWSNGAEITLMGPGVFLAPDADEPQGSFLFTDSTLRMSFPTQAQKLYILDCRVTPIANAFQVKVQRPGAADVAVPAQDGHILHVFTAKEATTKLALRFVPPTDFPASSYFYGCDFGKAN